MLRSQGMSANHLNTVFVALVISRLLYMLYLHGECLSLLVNAAKSMLFQTSPRGFCKEIVTFNDLLTNSAETLFSKVQASNHCLHALLPEKDPKLYYQKIVIGLPATYYLNADLICTKVPSLIGVCLTCDNAMLSVSSYCCYVFMHVCCINLIKYETEYILHTTDAHYLY